MPWHPRFVHWRRRQCDVLGNSRARWGYVGLLVLGSALVVAVGWLGGKPVYQLGVGVR